jgi:GDP-4-dehydro-6-deoxy-D-mannose reductase
VRILVTGASGFAGSHLLRDLLRGGFEVIGGCLGGSPDSTSVLSPEESDAVRWVQLDVTDVHSVRAVVREAAPQRIYHLAGQASVADSFDDPLGTWDVNAFGTLRLLEAARRHASDCRILIVSTAEVHGAIAAADLPVREALPLRPISPYGASKAAAEMAACEAAARGLHVVVVRSFNHIGPGQSTRFAVSSFAAQIVGMRPEHAPHVLRVGNLEVERDFLDIRDAVRAYQLVMERGAPGEVFNVCGGQGVRLRSLVERLIEISGTRAAIEVDPDRFREIDVQKVVGDPSRLQALGWRAEIELDQTLHDLFSAAAVSVS